MLCRLKLFSMLLLLVAGCSRNERAQMEQKVGEDHVRMVSRYQAAGVMEVESVLNEFLALADGYERLGWGKYGAPGWIENLRGLNEARLSNLFDATGRPELSRLHLERALVHFRRLDPKVAWTESGIREGIAGLDASNIQPRWWTELRTQAVATNGVQSVPESDAGTVAGWPAGPATKHAYLEVTLANRTGTLLEETAVQFGQHSIYSGILGPDASKTYLGWNDPVTTNAVVRWLDVQKSKLEAVVLLLDVYEPRATGVLTFTITTTNVAVAFKVIDRR